MQIRYVAGKDIKARNINVRKGEELPESWRSAVLVRALRKQFGEDAVVTLAGQGLKDPVLVAPKAPAAGPAPAAPALQKQEARPAGKPKKK